MIKTVPTAGRIAVMALFALSSFGACLYLWMAFGGSSPMKPKGYRVQVAFPEATALANQSDVRISGVSVGKVIRLEPNARRDRTTATIELRPKYAPIPRDTKAILRVKSLLGETFVELTPGNRRGPSVPDNGSLHDAAVSPTVEIDEIFSTFDAKTRAAFRTWMQSQAAAVQGRGTDINAFFGQLPGFTQKFDDLFTTLDAQQAATSKAISTTGEVFDAISQREGELRGLVTDSERLFATTAARNRQLAQIFEKLPRFERESSATLPKLTAFGQKAQPVVEQLQPAATQMKPAFAALDQLAPQFDGFFGQLKDVVKASEAGLPAFDRILGNLPPLFDAFQPFLRNANPMVDYIGKNKREVTSFFANTAAASEARDFNEVLPGAKGAVHYLRTSQSLTPESLTFYPRPLGSSRLNAYPKPGSLDELASGLSILGNGDCAGPELTPPADADPQELAPLVAQFAFRSDGAPVARPACKPQGAYPGFSTAVPQLRAER
ncbi:MAG TPA: MlaD family protein [Baekduia sp.]|uniref:MlaD family protein n=1 Tax=Baekduia sp. TaxID=2600305 RepID=UPI002CC2CF5A|nr:MlaD family protein [Baekduia sp.]HMJ37626.1 MlaD family protein [Baekduia sp.]